MDIWFTLIILEMGLCITVDCNEEDCHCLVFNPVEIPNTDGNWKGMDPDEIDPLSGKGLFDDDHICEDCKHHRHQHAPGI